jgi:hypothetical protein
MSRLNYVSRMCITSNLKGGLSTYLHCSLFMSVRKIITFENPKKLSPLKTLKLEPLDAKIIFFNFFFFFFWGVRGSQVGGWVVASRLFWSLRVTSIYVEQMLFIRSFMCLLYLRQACLSSFCRLPQDLNKCVKLIHHVSLPKWSHHIF